MDSHDFSEKAKSLTLEYGYLEDGHYLYGNSLKLNNDLITWESKSPKDVLGVKYFTEIEKNIFLEILFYANYVVPHYFNYDDFIDISIERGYSLGLKLFARLVKEKTIVPEIYLVGGMNYDYKFWNFLGITPTYLLNIIFQKHIWYFSFFISSPGYDFFYGTSFILSKIKLSYVRNMHGELAEYYPFVLGLLGPDSGIGGINFQYEKYQISIYFNNFEIGLFALRWGIQKDAEKYSLGISLSYYFKGNTYE